MDKSNHPSVSKLDLKKMGAEARRHAREIAAFLDTAPIGLHWVGPDGIILWVNDAELNILGYAREEYIGRHIAEFHADKRLVADILARLQRGEKVVECEAELRCKDGSRKSVLIDSSALWEEDRFIHTLCFTRDITERRKAEAMQALLSAIVASSDDAIVSKNLNGIITSWNTAAERMFGFTAKEAIGSSIEIIIPPERLGEEREILRRLRLGERIDHFETVRQAKDSHRFDVSLTISPIKEESGRIIGASKIARDITDRKRLEAEREQANRRKDEFIAILAHELRNPLAPVRNAAHYLKLKGAADPEVGQPLEIIERQVAQMSRLVDDLLDVARLSHGGLQLRRERVSCSEIVDAAVDACRDEIRAKRHNLRTTLRNQPIELEADRERLVQVLCNLIGNAAKYTPNCGQIDLTVGTNHQTLEISVKDNGIGIPPAKVGEIFDLFTRVDHPLERQGGLGIGLTLVRQLVELHGGTVEARSEGIGHGSEFVVMLPIVTAATTPEATRAESDTTCVPRRILVADDNQDAADSLALLLEIAGHEVHVVFDGDEAISAAEELHPEVALLDIGMPRANGYEVARHIRTQPYGKQIYLIALTGWGQDGDKQRAYDAGFDAHLVKPVPPDELYQLLAALADRSTNQNIN